MSTNALSYVDKSRSDSTYVQGMNVLAAPFLYVMPSEVEAFACFTTLLEVHAPRYVRPTLEGVHQGLKVGAESTPGPCLPCISFTAVNTCSPPLRPQLVDKCLEAVEPALYAHLVSHELTAELYAFAPLLTLSASTPPLQEVLEMWDFLLAYGVGLNVLCVVAQLCLIKSDLINSTS